ncbi:hypothetical protein N7481_012924 [Penicillium waksmanii]|uniref:uncharacterized protein n=1 Tax=Penicillium waksmanii TaxID=69791 RepID=UPI0025496B32|nr:uncharacterized protein N7481_012924 [Penicillium waksmanii]KAJ5966210.1 hypothetical protein N7481_012924 [Penicillium waksmanii]
MILLGKQLKIVLVGDARVGKSSWLSQQLEGFYEPEYTPTNGYNSERLDCQTNIGLAQTMIWDISGSNSTAQDRAKWMEDCDAAIIMVDLADRASIENTVSWYKEIISSQKQTLLPVVICSYKAYEKSDKRAIDPAEISWSDELGNTPFFYNISRDINVKPNRMLSNKDMMKPIGWILEQLTGETDVDANFGYVPSRDASPSRPVWPDGFSHELVEAASRTLEDDDEENL